MLANGGDLNAVLVQLRQAGFSKVESIRAIMELKGTSLGEAKRLIHLSPAWQDTLESDDRLHELLQTTAESLSNKDGQG
jgi:ribosomal protein L7/L12